MATRRGKALTALAVFLAFGLSQVYVQAGLPNSTVAPEPQQAITATLRTKNNQPVKINGNDTGTGTTLLTGTTIETPDQVSAVIDLGAAGTVEVGPNSKIELSFDANGNIQVKVVRGCSVVKKKGGDIGEADVSSDTIHDVTDPKKRNAGGCLLANGQFGPFEGAGLSALEITGIIIPSVVIPAVALSRGGDSSTTDF